MLTITQSIFIKIIRWYFRNTSPTDFEMVKYWKTKQGVFAKLTKDKAGNTVMYMEGEKYPFPGLPRAHFLYGPLSKLKHEIKNQIFNESWRKLEEGIPKAEILKEKKKIVKEGIKVKDASPVYGRQYREGEDLLEIIQYDLFPTKTMCPAVREIHRAWTKVSPETWKLRDILCAILQEDDSYRWRMSWLCEWFGWLMKLNPVKSFEFALGMLEHGEVINDMKERQRLLKRVLMLTLEDPTIRAKFVALFREIDWKKVRLTKGDKYHFRGKYFKVDYKYIEY